MTCFALWQQVLRENEVLGHECSIPQPVGAWHLRHHRKGAFHQQWARQVLAIPDVAVVSVNEISCALPDCPPKETVILVMSNGDTIQVSIHKAMADVLEHDVADAFRALQHS